MAFFNILSIRDGHFIWCRNHDDRYSHGCFSCQTWGYGAMFAVTLVYALIELATSFHFESLAFRGEGFHMFFDGTSYGISALAFFLIARAASQKRQEIFQRRFGVIIAFLLIVSAVWVGWEARERWLAGGSNIQASLLLVLVAGGGLYVNIEVLRLLLALRARHSHGHHSHEHHPSNNILLANIWHTIQDIGASALVIVVSLAGVGGSGYIQTLDLVATLVICLILLGQGWKMLYDIPVPSNSP